MKSRRVPPPAFLVHDPEKYALQRALEQAARPAVRLVRVFRVLLMSAPDKFWNQNLKENYHGRTGRGATIAIGSLFARGAMDIAAMRAGLYVYRGNCHYSCVGRQWPCLWLFRHLAIDHQHRHHDHNFSHGVPDPKHR
jgi:hypothetical protein